MKIRPLHDRVIVKRLDEEKKSAGGIVIPDTAAEKPSQGEVVHVGPGKTDDNGKLVPMGVKVGEGGKLYGSITAKDIADALGRRGIVVDRHKIDLAEPLKTLGTYKVAIRVHAGLTPEVTIAVEPKG